MDNKLNFVLYFRSWDLGLDFRPTFAAIQLLKEYMCQEIGCGDGTITAVSKGLSPLRIYICTRLETSAAGIIEA